MSSLYAAYLLAGLLGVTLAALTGSFTWRLFKTRAIRDIVTTANSTIELYEARETALEGKIDELTAKVSSLETALTAALAQNDILQKMLVDAMSKNVTLPVKEGSNVTVSLGEPVHGPDAPPAA